MEKRELLYQGKAKDVYATCNPDYLIIEFKDDATAFDGLKRGQITNKGEINNRISTIIFRLLEDNGIHTHFYKQFSAREMLVKKLNILKVEVVVRNISAGSLSRRLGIEEGLELNSPILEFYYKDDALKDPMINEYHIYALSLATPEQVSGITCLAFKINDILKEHLLSKKMLLVDFKLEFGLHREALMLGDEISPDTCRFWDASTHDKLDKDRFRRDLGGVTEAYAEVLKRLEGA
ncbi:MAG: Phosphoribosylaminoimidazole-succinocarboxamide synthase [candidate division WS2 bacterium]|nr:Phosphoribosylaminoimidazole-succinocarboxamide synthase [Candidatus Lithacetigena glycinireducens]